MPLFEAVIIEKDPETKDETLILGPIPIIARNKAAVVIAAVLKAKDMPFNQEHAEVLVRPFLG